MITLPDSHNLPSELYPSIFNQNDDIIEENLFLDVIARSLSETNLLKKRKNEFHSRKPSSKKVDDSKIIIENSIKTPANKKPVVVSPRTKFLAHKEKYTNYILKLLGCTFVKKTAPRNSSNTKNSNLCFSAAFGQSNRKKFSLTAIKEIARTHRNIESQLCKPIYQNSKGVISPSLNEYLYNERAKTARHDSTLSRKLCLESMQKRISTVQRYSKTPLNKCIGTDKPLLISRNRCSLKPIPKSYALDSKISVKAANKQQEVKHIYEDVGFRIKKAQKLHLSLNSK